jgi:hypothetical protein
MAKGAPLKLSYPQNNLADRRRIAETLPGVRISTCPDQFKA